MYDCVCIYVYICIYIIDIIIIYYYYIYIFMFVCVREFRTRYSSFLSAMCQWQYDFFCQQGYLRTDQAPAQKKLSGVVRSLQIVHSGKVFTISKTIPGGSQFWMFSFWKGECNNMLYTVHRALPGAQSRRKRNSMRDFQSPSPA